MSDDAGGDHQQQQQQQQQQFTNDTNTSGPPGSARDRVIELFKQDKLNAATWCTRMLTIIFTIAYVLPLFGTQQSYFNKVLLANAATSALRLHTRLPTFTLSREFLARVFIEDSFHYLMYSLIFFNVQPTLLILMPVVLFALLHASSYGLKILDAIGQNSLSGIRFIISLVEFQASNILRAAAFSEIFLMVVAVIFTFMGKAGLVTPIVYYHFLAMRYSSRRNPYTHNAFAELRVATERLAARSPPFVQKILHVGINFVCRLAPQPQPQPQQPQQPATQ